MDPGKQGHAATDPQKMAGLTKSRAGRPPRHKWVYLAIDAVRKHGSAVDATPTNPLDARRRALVKSIVATSNRGKDQKVRVVFSPDERSARFTFKT